MRYGNIQNRKKNIYAFFYTLNQPALHLVLLVKNCENLYFVKISLLFNVQPLFGSWLYKMLKEGLASFWLSIYILIHYVTTIKNTYINAFLALFFESI